jgi:gamma-glutamylcyclotransferase (GGCT)/AIG2-like uncharacterized protein YtfP
MHRIAVYGTLRRGHGAHSILRDCRFVETERVPCYDMFNLYGFPGIKKNKDNPLGIKVEIYDNVNDDTLAHMDHYEGVPRGMFRRDTVEIGGEPTSLYVYNDNVEHFGKINSGDWDDR